MTAQAMIDALTKIVAKHGPGTPVFFDCPQCGISYEPGTCATEAVHAQVEKGSKK